MSQSKCLHDAQPALGWDGRAWPAPTDNTGQSSGSPSPPQGSHPHSEGPIPTLRVPVPNTGVPPLPWRFLSPLRGSLSPPQGSVSPSWGCPVSSLGVPVPTPGIHVPTVGMSCPLPGSPCPHPGRSPSSPQGYHPHPWRFLSLPQGSLSPSLGVPSPPWRSLCPPWESLPRESHCSSQISAFTQTPPHTTSASGVCPPLPVCPLGTCWVRPRPRGLCCPRGQWGWHPGPPVGAQPPTSPSALPGGSLGWGSPNHAFPAGVTPPDSPCPQGGGGQFHPHTPPPLTPAEMKDGPAPPAAPQNPLTVCYWGVRCELPPTKPLSCRALCLVVFGKSGLIFVMFHAVGVVELSTWQGGVWEGGQD
ncbi:proline-rich protein 2-like [Chiroxiphia lanceolata]|uniref:proline-rich protein 2-like n=1 Tax=Chiroxiphia lanceolata TaxID=296741 RepID=UPI0013CEF0C7|nr:proline-rich protein 2-like [Chiroxiphia lanceolata]